MEATLAFSFISLGLFTIDMRTYAKTTPRNLKPKQRPPVTQLIIARRTHITIFKPTAEEWDAKKQLSNGGSQCLEVGACIDEYSTAVVLKL